MRLAYVDRKHMQQRAGFYRIFLKARTPRYIISDGDSSSIFDIYAMNV